MRGLIGIFSLVGAFAAAATCAPNIQVVVSIFEDGTNEYGWRFSTEGAGGVNAIEFVGRPIGATSWQTDLRPPNIARGAYQYMKLQDAFASGGDAACVVQYVVENYPYLYDQVGGFSVELQLGWLNQDQDGDGVFNLADPDQAIFCADPFDVESCNVATGSGLPPSTVDPPAEALGSAAPFPYSTGSWANEYACTTSLAFGGTTITDWAGSSFGTVGTSWPKKYYRDRQYFGTPSTPKPYEGAYNLVRGGAGGGETAYFSAVWGKKAAYVLSDATTTNFGDKLRLGTDFVWHRYVMYGGGQGEMNKYFFQFWHSTSNCWRPLGVWMYPVGPSNAFVTTAYVDASYAAYFIPPGFQPGDVVGETASNIPSGTYVIPAAGASGWPDIGAPTSGTGATGTTSSGVPGSGLTQSGIEQAFAAALYGASGGMAYDGAAAVGTMLGQGAGGTGGAVGYLFGEEYNGAGLFELGGANSAAGALSSGLVDMAEGPLAMDMLGSTDQAAYTVSVALPIPGMGDYVANLSTLPDTSWAPGQALNVARIMFRVLISLILVYRFVFAVLSIFGWK